MFSDSRQLEKAGGTYNDAAYKNGIYLIVTSSQISKELTREFTRKILHGDNQPFLHEGRRYLISAAFFESEEDATTEEVTFELRPVDVPIPQTPLTNHW